MMRRPTRGDWLGLVVLGALSLVALLAPWVRSGSATRNSFEMFRTAQRLGLDSLTPYRVIWFLVPVIGSAGLVLVMLGHRRLASVPLLAVGLVMIGAAVAVQASSVRVGPGVVMGAAAGVAHVGFVPWLLRPEPATALRAAGE